MSSRLLFASDLDNTLLYSYKDAAPNDICVEEKDGKALSFMPVKTYALLKEIVKLCLFVPVTTRSTEQYQRLNIGVLPKYALVAQGAVLIENGVENTDWINETRSIVTSDVPMIEEDQIFTRVRVIENLYIEAKISSESRAREYLDRYIDRSVFSVLFSYNKAYVIPHLLNKGMALKRLKEKLKTDIVISAGDSVLDIPMLDASDYAIFPSILNCANKNAYKVDAEVFPQYVPIIVQELLSILLQR